LIAKRERARLRSFSSGRRSPLTRRVRALERGVADFAIAVVVAAAALGAKGSAALEPLAK